MIAWLKKDLNFCARDWFGCLDVRDAMTWILLLPEKTYKTLDESTKILRFEVPFPIIVVVVVVVSTFARWPRKLFRQPFVEQCCWTSPAFVNSCALSWMIKFVKKWCLCIFPQTPHLSPLFFEPSDM
ncbi:hypothetical protein CsSME_00012065 [Camellia sinensis var. sinensis]